jgi:hypothetical protein
MNDLFGVVGLAAIGVGTYNRFGWDYACIIVGTILLVLAVFGAMRQ